MGNEISKALEADVLASPQGIVAERLTDSGSGSGSAPVAAARRSAQDVAQREQLFGFCVDWDLQQLTDFLRWYERLHARTDASTKTLDLRRLPEQVDALEQAIVARQTLLHDVDNELRALTPNAVDPESDEHELVCATLENRREELMDEIREAQRALQDRKVHLLATLDGVDLSRTVAWPAFIKAVSQVQVHTKLHDSAVVQSAWHPAAVGYAMERNSLAKKELGEFAKGDVLLPPPANHEIDGHTDDSASSSAASEDNASSRGDGDPSDDGDAAPGSQRAAETEGDAGGGDENAKRRVRDDEEDEEDEEDDAEEEAADTKAQPTVESAAGQEATTALTADALAEHTEQTVPSESPVATYQSSLKRPRVIKRPVPVAFDPAMRSPVFFGYTLEKQPDELVQAVSEDDTLAAKEAALFEQKIQRRKTELDEALQTERGKVDVLAQREAEAAQKRVRYWEKRDADLERAKKELDPNDIFFRTREIQDKKTRDNQAFEDDELRRQRDKIEARRAAAQLEYDRSVDQLRAVRSTETPLGDTRMRFHEAEVDQYHAEMLLAKAALATAKEEYVALTSTKTLRIGNQEAKNRAQLLYAEDQIRAREKDLEAVCALYESELFLLQRAQELYAREQLFLPFFACLQQQHDPRRTTVPQTGTFDRTHAFTVLEMAVALLMGLGGVDVRAKIAFLFRLFCQRASTRTGSIGAAIELLQRDAFAELLRVSLLVLSKLGDFRPRQALTLEYLRGLADREFLKLDVVLELDDMAALRNGMTAVEFEAYCLDVVATSKYLCELLGVPWRYEQLSRFVVQHMSAVHKYKLGLLNVNDLKFAIAKQSITARPELSRWKKDVIHERALAMGENDPLKTDYSKYLPKRRTKLLSKVVPLDHGGYRNVLHYRMEVIVRATVKLQTTWRARKGRQLARLAAEKQAFYHARGVALQDARDTVEREWSDKDAKPAHTVEKMKFEAKIRMKQVKLRTKGNAFSREQVLALLMEEAVQTAQKEVEHRFREMEEELGYLKHDVALVKPLDDVEYLNDDISKALVTQVVQAKHENADVGAVMDAIALTEEVEKKKKLAKKPPQDSKVSSGGAATTTTTTNQETVVTITSGGTGDDEPEQHLDHPEDKAQRLARTQQRHDHMIFGRFPRELYTSGRTREDHAFEMLQAFPDPALVALQARLQRVCVGMTDFKMAELLQELPSKRHICAYVTSFRRHDGTYEVDRLEHDLVDHFRMVRGARALAEALVGLAETDLEGGRTRDLLAVVEAQSDAALRQLVTRESSVVAERNTDALAKKLVRMGYKTPGIDDASRARANDVNDTNDTNAVALEQGNPMAVVLQKEQHELVEKKKRLDDAHTRFVDAMRLWREAELSFHETQKGQLKVQATYPIVPTHRTKWAERLRHALLLPEANATELQDKYTEAHDVCHDFIETCTAIARVLVREIHLPVSHKSILPVRDAAIDGRKDDVRTTRRLKFEAHGILFTICTDDHGRCEQSDELAAKCGGHEVRNSALYHRALLSHAPRAVLLPLACVVDCGGFRVLCASKVPIETVVWNEAGTAIQKVSKQLVHGTENRGKTITFQSKELDTLLASAAARLNLSRHGVRGYHDLTSKVLHAPADLRGYVDAEKRFVLVHFARAMPPEDPEMTPHLGSSTRGLSILWRQLRPELVASFKTPLSPDALSSMTYGTPDWLSQATGVEDATRELVETGIPSFARKLSQRPDYFSAATASTFPLTDEMHRHGINVRHLGLLRAQFPVALSGSATLQYATGEIQTSEDFTRQVERGAPVYILGKAYTVSRLSKHRYDAHCITLNEVYMGDSIQHVTVVAGRQDCQRNAAAIRDRVLAEMVARTLKNILRHLLRTAAQRCGSGLTPMLHRRIVIHCFNLLTGSARGSEADFWTVQLYEGIRVRFGLRAVSEVDRQNLRRGMLPHLHVVATRVAAMLGLHIRAASLQRLAQRPDCYAFVLDDLDERGSVESPCRVKHNLAVLHFSMASLLLLQATVTQATSYKQLVLGDRPHGYWPLCERRGLVAAVNYGSYGAALNGRYLAACTLEADGPVANTDLNRAVELRKEKRSYVAFPVVPELYPRDASTHATLEAWCKCDGHASTRRVVLTIGRFTLSALKANAWAFSVNVKNIDILAFGAQVELHKWTHLVGTFDGTMLRLFVDGVLQNEVDVESVVDLELAKREAVIAKTRQDIADLEEDARGKCFKDVDRELQPFFSTKDGKKQIKSVSQKLLDEHEFRVRLSKAATSAPPASSSSSVKATTPSSSSTSSKRDLSTVTRADFEPLAKKQLLREAFERRVESVVAEFKEMRHRVNDKIAKELVEQRTADARELRIGCLSSASRRDGKHFFHGSLAHVAYYNGTVLTRDHVNAHYVVGVRDRAHVSDDLFALASSRFARALAFAPDDPRTLEKFAENVCASLKYDLDHRHAHALYKKKVRCGLAPLVATENVHGVAEILKHLPREPAFSELFVDCYRAVLAIRPDYFHATESGHCRLALRELGRLPFDFFLGSKSANALTNLGGGDTEHDHDHVAVFADVIQKVLADYPSFYGDQLTNLNWLRTLTNPRVVVHVVLCLEAGNDVRYVDLTPVRDLGPDDLVVIATHTRFALGFAVSHCTLLTDAALTRLAQCCTQLEELDVSYCSLLTDAALHAVATHCTRLKQLRLVHCHHMSDLGVEAVVRANPRLETLALSYCERVSERCMATIGASCPQLTVLELEMCVQLGSTALRLLVGALVHPTTLRTLNLAGCHRVSDDGLLAVARACTRLQHVNLRLCDKLTDTSLRVLTHHSLELETLNLEDVVQATYRLFQFDQEGDGRAVVDKHLIKKLRVLDLSGCAAMNDLALGHIGHRAKRLEAITLAACAAITDQGLHWLLVDDMLDKSRCGEQLEQLDVSYCPQLTASGLHSVVRHCPKLVALNLSGCVHLTDENVVAIIDACSKLVRLELAFCRDLTDVVLLAIARHLSLEVLNMGRCVKVTDDGMRELAGQLTVLRTLNVSACKRLTDATLRGLLEACPLLEELDVTHCPFFSADVLARFVGRNVKVVCAKIEDVSVAEAVEKQTKVEATKVRRSSRALGGEEDSESTNGRDEVSDTSRLAVVADAKKPTRTARLPGSLDSSLPLIRQQRTRDRDPASP